MGTADHLPLRDAKRAAILLATAQAVGGSVGPIAIGVGGLVGASLLPPEDIALATVPVTTFILGAAIASIPAALAMQRIGRRAGFVAGSLIGAGGAVFSAVAILAGSFVLFALAALMLGTGHAFGQQYRYAAADAAEPSFKAKAISWTIAGGVVTGVVGPQVSIHGRGLLDAAPFAGPYLVLAGLFVVAALILSRLKVPPPRPLEAGDDRGRPLIQVVTQGRFVVALLAAITSYALMTFVMTATPIAMIEHHHHGHTDAQLGIQWHVIAMFGPSFFSGALVARFGRGVMAAAGLILIALASVVALAGTSVAFFWTALILLGVGWNFGYVAATAMIAGLYRPAEAFRVQAFSEFTLFGIVAAASFSSGKVLAQAGWETVNWIVLPVVGLTLALLALQALAERRTTSAAGSA